MCRWHCDASSRDTNSHTNGRFSCYIQNHDDISKSGYITAVYVIYILHNMILSYIINEYIIIGWFCVQACQDNLNARSELISCIKGNTSRWQVQKMTSYTHKGSWWFSQTILKCRCRFCFSEYLARISWGFTAEIKKTWNLLSDKSDFVNGSLVTQSMLYRSIFIRFNENVSLLYFDRILDTVLNRKGKHYSMLLVILVM